MKCIIVRNSGKPLSMVVDGNKFQIRDGVTEIGEGGGKIKEDVAYLFVRHNESKCEIKETEAKEPEPAKEETATEQEVAEPTETSNKPKRGRKKKGE